MSGHMAGASPGRGLISYMLRTQGNDGDGSIIDTTDMIDRIGTQVVRLIRRGKVSLRGRSPFGRHL